MPRIIAGTAKGRRLTVPGGARPTTDQVREAAFSVIAGWAGTAAAASRALDGCSFLDLYAGSGAVALEAASRGARPVCAVESDRRAATVIGRNAAAAGLPVDVVQRTVEAFAARPVRTPFDVVWADPPYDVPDETVDALLAALAANGALAASCLVVVERDKRSRPPAWPDGVEALANRVYGDTALHFATRGAA